MAEDGAPTDSARADRMSDIAAHIMAAIPDAYLDDPHVLAAALGAVCGTFAAATGTPGQFLGALIAVAVSITSGDLVKPT